MTHVCKSQVSRDSVAGSLEPGVGLEGLFLAVEYPDLSWKFMYSFLFVCFFVFVFCLFRAAPEAYGGSQARGPIKL